MSNPVSLRVLAEFFCARREQITSEWIERVRQERTIPAADAVRREELMDLETEVGRGTRFRVVLPREQE
jgi:hypothetical protein